MIPARTSSALLFVTAVLLLTAAEPTEWVVEIPRGPLAVVALSKCLGIHVLSPLVGFRNAYRLLGATDSSEYTDSRIVHCATIFNILWMKKQEPMAIELLQPDFSVVDWNDELYNKMWYLNPNADPSTVYDMGVQAAWKIGYSGNGVKVAAVDSGLQYRHPDLQKNYDSTGSYNFDTNQPDPHIGEDETNTHGTSVAAIVAAESNNSVCIPGIAYNTNLSGIVLPLWNFTERVEADIFSFKNEYIDIYTNSWVRLKFGERLLPLGQLSKKALERAATEGRNGLGNIFVWAAGNSALFPDNCGLHEYMTVPSTIGVGAVSAMNEKSWYSEQCASLFVSAYSNGSLNDNKEMMSIAPSGCTESFGGTSAAAPQVAAVIALSLEANPRLTWRDVRHLIVKTANRSLLPQNSFIMNAAGNTHSPDYGFGLIHAERMVQLAKIWQTVPPEHQCWSAEQSVNRELSEEFDHKMNFTFTACDDSAQSEVGQSVHHLEGVQLIVDIQYGRRGLLQIHLVSPSGTKSRVFYPRWRDVNEGETDLAKLPLTTYQLWGEDPQGVWQLQIDNTAGTDAAKLPKPVQYTGLLRSFKLLAYGTESNPTKLYQPQSDGKPPEMT